MTHWQITIALGLCGAAVGLLYNISSKMDDAVKLLKQIDSRNQYRGRQDGS